MHIDIGGGPDKPDIDPPHVPNKSDKTNTEEKLRATRGDLFWQFETT